jgi:hypothetical protein
VSAATPSRDDVLESFLLESDETDALQRYLRDYPAFAVELIDLAHQMRREIPDIVESFTPEERAAIDTALRVVGNAWPAAPAGSQDLFAVLGPADYGRLSATLDVPRQVVAAIRNRRAIPDTIPRGFLRRMAEALNGSIDDLLFSMGARSLAASFKAVDRLAAVEPVSFEQILIDARVPEERRLAIMAERD